MHPLLSRQDRQSELAQVYRHICIFATSFTPLKRHENLSRLGINASDVRDKVTDSSRVSVLVVVLVVSSGIQLIAG